LVVAADAIRSREVASLLEARGYRVDHEKSSAATLALVRRQRPALAVWTAGQDRDGKFSDLRIELRNLGISILDVIEDGAVPQAEAGVEAADFVFHANLGQELLLRVERLLSRQRSAESGSRAAGLLGDGNFLPLIVHDLRTPLNVVGLSLRMIEQALPKGNAELEEDLRFVEENFKQIERMLALLSDYCRLFESGVPCQATPFSPERLLNEVIEGRTQKPGQKPVPVELEIGQTCPPEVMLDPLRARQALQYVLINSMAASNGTGIRVALGGDADRWVTQFVIDRPPPPSVKSVSLDSQRFERLCGTAAERRGMDLAIAARISELFGGHARLEVLADQSTNVVLDWPARLPA
jgi:signal transduction histidine kinase